MQTRHFAALIGLMALSGACALPQGFMTFFETLSCPEGWTEFSASKGRLIISVSDGSQAGVTVNQPLADREDRAHDHSYATVATLPEKDIAAIGCCNDQGAAHGSYPISGPMQNSSSGYPFTQLLLCRFGNNTDDPVPFGTIGYFSTDVSECPDDWVPLSGGNGRFIVPSYDESGTVSSPAKPLTSGQDITHNHYFASSFDTDDVTYAGVAGCCNDDTAGSGTVTVQGNTSSDSSNLPYIQLLTCVSGEETFNASLPWGVTIFSTVKCPPGWEIFTLAAGRLLVSLPDGASDVGASWGGASLDPGASNEVTHAHDFSGSVQTSSTGVGLATGCCADGYASNGVYKYYGVSDETYIELPYLMAPMCIQSSTSRMSKH